MFGVDEAPPAPLNFGLPGFARFLGFSAFDLALQRQNVCDRLVRAAYLFDGESLNGSTSQALSAFRYRDLAESVPTPRD